jgi:hypothetical protein
MQRRGPGAHGADQPRTQSTPAVFRQHVELLEVGVVAEVLAQREPHRTVGLRADDPEQAGPLGLGEVIERGRVRRKAGGLRERVEQRAGPPFDLRKQPDLAGRCEPELVSQAQRP